MIKKVKKIDTTEVLQQPYTFFSEFLVLFLVTFQNYSVIGQGHQLLYSLVSSVKSIKKKYCGYTTTLISLTN